MGYEINSPVKTIHLPLDYNWLAEIGGDEPSITEFFRLYKEKYGIDLNDVIYNKGPIRTAEDLFSKGIIKCYDVNNHIVYTQTILYGVIESGNVILNFWIASLFGEGVRISFGFKLTWAVGSNFEDGYMGFSEL